MLNKKTKKKLKEIDKPELIFLKFSGFKRCRRRKKP